MIPQFVPFIASVSNQFQVPHSSLCFLFPKSFAVLSSDIPFGCAKAYPHSNYAKNQKEIPETTRSTLIELTSVFFTSLLLCLKKRKHSSAMIAWY